MEVYLVKWFKGKTSEFWARQFHYQLKKRWDLVVEAGGEYFDEKRIK